MKKNKKNNNYISRFIFIIVFISIIVQCNIFITDSVKSHLKQEKINKERMLCPPDICTVNEPTNPPELEILDFDVEPIKVEELKK